MPRDPKNGTGKRGRKPRLPENGRLCCGRCKRLLPATATYFYRNRKAPSGFCSYCKDCQDARRDTKYNQIRTELGLPKRHNKTTRREAKEKCVHPLAVGTPHENDPIWRTDVPDEEWEANAMERFECMLSKATKPRN